MSVAINAPTSVHELLARAAASCVSAVPDKNGYVPPHTCNSNYDYYPSFALAVIFCGLFLLTTVLHIFQAFYYKKGFCAVIIMGALWEVASFILRVLGTKDQQKRFYASNSFLLFTLAPLWINAFVYMVAGRLIFCFVPSRKVFGIKATWIGKLFVVFDIISFIIQLSGGLMISPGASEANKQNGLHIYQAGIGAQQGFVVMFIVVMIGFHKSMYDLEKTGWRDNLGRKWKLMIWLLYLILLLITIRIIYRLAEYLLGLDDSNPLPNHEVYMYVLDAVPMFVSLAILNIMHPGRVLFGPGSDYRQGKKQLRLEKKVAKKARKQGKRDTVNGYGDDEERMIGYELSSRNGSTAYLGTEPSTYSPLSHERAGASHLQPPLYDPHRGHG
ncbi:uncharacterized protein BDR25DRAFT_304838 [Lindgomyces ingoldianus]|uniref:Uncharacterized protein n=1 Tax=Lindgomyces ingoldianus TaxID=673940 RepID=A0ACB6QPH8_9PLEO|nr:uncharacterized protein BDR25DRAFT_304838 [Lindgomyces ingoldianus]KAF2468914.1 hypothetical protein BDR25DRAFT_304838 [Lindgomyces ingoldianus]